MCSVQHVKVTELNEVDQLRKADVHDAHPDII